MPVDHQTKNDTEFYYNLLLIHIFFTYLSYKSQYGKPGPNANARKIASKGVLNNI